MTAPNPASIVAERTTEWVFGLEWFDEPRPGTAVLTARNLAARCGASAFATMAVGQTGLYAIGSVPPFGVKGLFRRFSAAAAIAADRGDWTAGFWPVGPGRWWFLLGYNKAPVAERLFDGTHDQAAAAFAIWTDQYGPEGGCSVIADPRAAGELAAAGIAPDRISAVALSDLLRTGRRVRVAPVDGRPARRMAWLAGLGALVVVGASTAGIGAVQAYLADDPVPVAVRAPPRPPTLALRAAPSAMLASCRNVWSTLIREVPTWSLAELTCAAGKATAVYQPGQAIVIQDVIRDAFGDHGVVFDPDFRKATVSAPVEVTRRRGAQEAPPLAFQEIRLRATAASTGYEIKIDPMPNIGERDPAGDNLLQRKLTITSPLPAIDWSARLDELPGLVVVGVTQRQQSGFPVWIIEGRIYGRS